MIVIIVMYVMSSLNSDVDNDLVIFEFDCIYNIKFAIGTLLL